MHLVSRTDQIVTIPGAGLRSRSPSGESIHTENSHKYTLDGLRTLADRSGFVEEAAWTDRRGFFRVQRWRVPPPRGRDPPPGIPRATPGCRASHQADRPVSITSTTCKSRPLPRHAVIPASSPGEGSTDILIRKRHTHSRHQT